jgi:putative membrane protein
MGFIIHLLVDAGIVYILAYLMPQVQIRDYKAAIWVALLVGLLNATIGWVFGAFLNIITLGLFAAIVRLFVTAVVIKIADKLVRKFEVKGFLPAIVIAVAIAVVGYFIDSMFQ